MLEHLVFIKTKADTRAEDVRNIIDSLNALRGVIPGVKEMRAGLNLSERSKGFNIGLRVRVCNEQDLIAYQSHPAHVSVVEKKIKPVLEDIMAVDYLHEHAFDSSLDSFHPTY